MSNVNLSFDSKRNVYAQVDMLFDAKRVFPASDIDYSNLSISLNSHTLSDTFDMTVPKGNLDIDYECEGTLLDMPYSFKIDSITERNGIMTYTGRYSSDKLLYTNYRLWVSYTKSIHEEEPQNVSYSVRALMQKMCNQLGLGLSFQCMDWQYPLNKLNEDDQFYYFGITGTYQNLISQLFGWLSDLPHIDFNVFIRSGVLYVIQRGHETGGTVTVTKAVFPYTVQKRRIRTEWQGSGNTQAEKTVDDEDAQVPFTGKIQFQDIEMTYENGYLMTEKDGDGNETEYTYIELNKQKYISRKETNNTVTGGSTVVVNDYQILGNQVYLIKETQTVTKVTDPETNPPTTETETTETVHVPVGNGCFVHTVKDGDGNVVQSSTSQGSPSNTVSPYMVDKTQEIYNTMTQQIVADILAGLLEYLHPPLIATNYPVKDRQTIEYLVNQTDWLNNKFEEKVTLELAEDEISEPHAIDFNDVISFRGNSYRLESNHITHDAENGIRQNLTIVRWF